MSFNFDPLSSVSFPQPCPDSSFDLPESVTQRCSEEERNNLSQLGLACLRNDSFQAIIKWRRLYREIYVIQDIVEANQRCHRERLSVKPDELKVFTLSTQEQYHEKLCYFSACRFLERETPWNVGKNNRDIHNRDIHRIDEIGDAWCSHINVAYFKSYQLVALLEGGLEAIDDYVRLAKAEIEKMVGENRLQPHSNFVKKFNQYLDGLHKFKARMKWAILCSMRVRLQAADRKKDIYYDDIIRDLLQQSETLNPSDITLKQYVSLINKLPPRRDLDSKTYGLFSKYLLMSDDTYLFHKLSWMSETSAHQHFFPLRTFKGTYAIFPKEISPLLSIEGITEHLVIDPFVFVQLYYFLSSESIQQFVQKDLEELKALFAGLTASIQSIEHATPSSENQSWSELQRTCLQAFRAGKAHLEAKHKRMLDNFLSRTEPSFEMYQLLLGLRDIYTDIPALDDFTKGYHESISRALVSKLLHSLQVFSGAVDWHIPLLSDIVNEEMKIRHQLNPVWRERVGRLMQDLRQSDSKDLLFITPDDLVAFSQLIQQSPEELKQHLLRMYIYPRYHLNLLQTWIMQPSPLPMDALSSCLTIGATKISITRENVITWVQAVRTAEVYKKALVQSIRHKLPILLELLKTNPVEVIHLEPLIDIIGSPQLLKEHAEAKFQILFNLHCYDVILNDAFLLRHRHEASVKRAISTFIATKMADFTHAEQRSAEIEKVIMLFTSQETYTQFLIKKDQSIIYKLKCVIEFKELESWLQQSQEMHFPATARGRMELENYLSSFLAHFDWKENVSRLIHVFFSHSKLYYDYNILFYRNIFFNNMFLQTHLKRVKSLPVSSSLLFSLFGLDVQEIYRKFATYLNQEKEKMLTEGVTLPDLELIRIRLDLLRPYLEIELLREVLPGEEDEFMAAYIHVEKLFEKCRRIILEAQSLNELLTDIPEESRRRAFAILREKYKTLMELNFSLHDEENLMKQQNMLIFFNCLVAVSARKPFSSTFLKDLSACTFQPPIPNTPVKQFLTKLAINATKQGSLMMLHILKRWNCPLKEYYENSYPLMHIAAKYGQLAIMQFLEAEGGSVKQVNGNDVTPLHSAAYGNQLSTVQWLISQKGADVFAVDNIKFTLLHCAASSGKTEVLQFLLSYKTLLGTTLDVNAKDERGRTPLHILMHSDTVNMDSVMLLLDHADINAADSAGQTPLHYAMHNQIRRYIIQEMIRAGGNLNLVDKHGKKPMEYSKDNEKSFYFESISLS